MKRIFLASLLSAALFLSYASVFAAPNLEVTQTPADMNGGGGQSIGNPSGQEIGNPTTKTSEPVATLPNPLKVGSLPALFKMIVNAIVSVAYVVVAIFLVLAGFKFVTAQGNEDKLNEAKTTFKNTIIGAIIIIGAQTIASILENIFKSLQI